jgi:ABC-2 type transport system permease protein
MLASQTWAEFLKLWRVPAFTLTSLFLPVMFYAFIGIGQSKEIVSPGVTFGAYFLASMAVYSVANVMIFSFGITVATERGMKTDLLMRATPLPALVYLVSKAITAVVFAAMTLVVLFPFAYWQAEYGSRPLSGRRWGQSAAGLLTVHRRRLRHRYLSGPTRRWP